MEKKDLITLLVKAAVQAALTLLVAALARLVSRKPKSEATQKQPSDKPDGLSIKFQGSLHINAAGKEHSGHKKKRLRTRNPRNKR